jgi:sulfur carrier protein ThiS adenylyltransferase
MRITVNGKKMDIDVSTAFQLRSQIGNKSDIIILNGYQIQEDNEIVEDDILTIIDKYTMVNKDELEHMLMARHTPNVHKKIKKGKVAIAGLGGLGSNIGVMLARTGIGELLLVDFDIVEPSNLNRQHYNISHLGMHKTEALKKQIEDINPYVEVHTKTIKVTEENVLDTFSGVDIICEAFDRPEAKSTLINVALEKIDNIKIVASSGMAGYGSSNLIRTINPMKRLYVCGDLQSEAKIGQGLMAPRVNICAGHQGNMILRLLLGINDI